MNIQKTAFASKSEAKRVKTQLGVGIDEEHEAVIHIYPVNKDKFAVVVKVDGKGLKARLCSDKKDILNYMEATL